MTFIDKNTEPEETLDTQLMHQEQLGAEELTDDLGLLSCLTAGEIGRLSMDFAGLPDVEHTKLLIQKIESWIPKAEEEVLPKSLAESHTIAAVAVTLSANNSTEVVTQARDKLSLLKRLVENPRLFVKDEKARLSELKTFCLQLSRNLRAASYPPDLNVYIGRKSEINEKFEKK